MIHQGIELLKYGVALGFAICVGAGVFFGIIGLVLLAVISRVRAKSEAEYEKNNKDKKV